MVKLYNLSGNGLKKLIPLSNVFILPISLLYVFTLPANVVVVVVATGHGLELTQWENIIVELLSFELS